MARVGGFGPDHPDRAGVCPIAPTCLIALGMRFMRPIALTCLIALGMRFMRPIALMRAVLPYVAPSCALLLRAAFKVSRHGLVPQCADMCRKLQALGVRYIGLALAGCDHHALSTRVATRRKPGTLTPA